MGAVTLLPGMEPMSLLFHTGKNINQVIFTHDLETGGLEVEDFTDTELANAMIPYLAEFVKEAFAEARKRINVFAEECRQKVVSGTTEMQRNGWNIKAQSAIRIIAGTEVSFDRPNIQKEADERDLGETVEQLSQIIIDKHAAFGNLEGIISGFQKKAEFAVDALEEAGDIINLEPTLTTLKSEAEVKLGQLLEAQGE